MFKLFLKGVSMFAKFLNRLIRGIPDEPQAAVEAAAGQAFRPAALHSPNMYEPEHRLSKIEVNGGVGADGSCWAEWRTCQSTGVKWFKRISDESAATPAIHAAADDADDTSGEIDAQIDWAAFDASFENLGNEIEAAAEPFDRVAFDAKFEELRERFPDPGFDITSYQPEGRYDE